MAAPQASVQWCISPRAASLTAVSVGKGTVLQALPPSLLLCSLWFVNILTLLGRKINYLGVYIINAVIYLKKNEDAC